MHKYCRDQVAVARTLCDFCEEDAEQSSPPQWCLQVKGFVGFTSLRLCRQHWLECLDKLAARERGEGVQPEVL